MSWASFRTDGSRAVRGGLRWQALALAVSLVWGGGAGRAAKAVPAEAAAAAAGKPWRVFLLSGQSNMGSKGAIKHLEQLLVDPVKGPAYAHLRPNGEWLVRDDVWLFGKDGSAAKLTVGSMQEGRFGPELGFGVTVGDALEEPVLVVRLSWGGRDLNMNFRPPSSGPGSFSAEQLEKAAAKYKVPPDRAAGLYYRELMRKTADALVNLERHVPASQGQGYELAGFVWHQGFNDFVGGDDSIDAYGGNLANLIRDVRRDLDSPELPVIIGELGMNGPLERLPTGTDKPGRNTARVKRFRAQQRGVAEAPEFKDTVRYVETGVFVPPDGEEPSFDGGYHYNGRASTVYKIGAAFGEAMLPLIGKEPRDDSRRVNAACRVLLEKYGGETAP